MNALSCVSSKSAGKLFNTRGPATEKLLSPKVLYVRGTKHVLSLSILHVHTRSMFPELFIDKFTLDLVQFISLIFSGTRKVDSLT